MNDNRGLVRLYLAKNVAALLDALTPEVKRLVNLVFNKFCQVSEARGWYLKSKDELEAEVYHILNECLQSPSKRSFADEKRLLRFLKKTLLCELRRFVYGKREVEGGELIKREKYDRKPRIKSLKHDVWREEELPTRWREDDQPWFEKLVLREAVAPSARRIAKPKTSPIVEELLDPANLKVPLSAIASELGIARQTADDWVKALAEPVAADISVVAQECGAIVYGKKWPGSAVKSGESDCYMVRGDSGSIRIDAAHPTHLNANGQNPSQVNHLRPNLENRPAIDLRDSGGR